MRRARIGSIGKRPTPRTGGGMKLPTKKVRPPKPTDTGGRVMPKKYKPRLQVDPRQPKKRRPRVSDTGFGLRRPRRPVPRPRRR
jgi:hypothetical protein